MRTHAHPGKDLQPPPNVPILFEVSWIGTPIFFGPIFFGPLKELLGFYIGFYAFLAYFAPAGPASACYDRRTIDGGLDLHPSVVSTDDGQNSFTLD
ncbi:hypothetical protein R3P38DRAFT_1051655 [Favolaschia claudopus]|uniref:Uncharacterized protein n=1 Tax=Favolaschia claudopus TaxID=2862362 RepID=A0AAW0BFE5_9AGAR